MNDNETGIPSQADVRPYAFGVGPALMSFAHAARDAEDQADEEIADRMMGFVDDIHLSFARMSESDLRAVLDGIVFDLRGSHMMRREQRVGPSASSLAETQPDPHLEDGREPQRTPEEAARSDDGSPFGPVPVPIPHYREGQAYTAEVVRAVQCAADGDLVAAEAHATAADRLLWPLGALDDPNDLRDFIAGLANGFDRLLMGWGVRVPM